jgi:hypothetical protein
MRRLEREMKDLEEKREQLRKKIAALKHANESKGEKR